MSLARLSRVAARHLPVRSSRCLHAPLLQHQRLPPPTMGCRRPHSTTTAGTEAPAAAAAAVSSSPPPQAKSGPGFFSRNAGKLALAVLSAIAAYIYRNSQSKKRSTAVKSSLELRRAVDPWEIDELRMANDQVLTPEVFGRVVEAVKASFPSGRAPYTDFIKVCGEVLGPDQRVVLGHYLDRVVYHHSPDGGEVDVMTLLCALSLTYNSLVADRTRLLHDLTVSLHGRVDDEAARHLVQGLVATAQCPVEVMVEADKEHEYPIQEYKVVSDAGLLVGKAREELEGKKKEKERVFLPSELSPEDLTMLLSTKAICAWGECYYRG